MDTISRNGVAENLDKETPGKIIYEHIGGDKTHINRLDCLTREEAVGIFDKLLSGHPIYIDEKCYSRFNFVDFFAEFGNANKEKHYSLFEELYNQYYQE